MFSFRFRLSLCLISSPHKSRYCILCFKTEMNEINFFDFSSITVSSVTPESVTFKFNYFGAWMASKLFLTRKSRRFRLTLGFHRYLKNFDGSVESFFLFCFFTFQQRKCISSLPLYHCLAFARELWTLNRCWNKKYIESDKILILISE